MMRMAKITMVCGMLLLIEGIVCYLGWKQLGAAKPSGTALIPAYVGVPLMFLGWLTLAKPNLRMHLMHGAVTLTLLGFLASAPMGVIGLIKKGAAVGPVAQLIMALICGLHVVLSVRSFIAARRARESGGVGA
jgi:hypothetical protein